MQPEYEEYYDDGGNVVDTSIPALSPIEELEQRDGARFAWMTWPSTKVEASRIIVPLSGMYTPLKPLDISFQVEYGPLRCHGKSCNAILNPYCELDLVNRIWVCPFCLTRNHLTQDYADITNENLPAELIIDYSTIEYLLPDEPQGAPTFLFVLDTCTIESELKIACNALMSSLALLPPDSSIGLITFGKHVRVHELGFAECCKSYVFRGNPNNDNIDAEFVADMLGFSKEQTSTDSKGFLLPISHCHDAIYAILDDLVKDPWPVKGDERPARATGVALSVSIGMMETLMKGKSARIILMSAGVASVGPGKVIGVKLEETIRSHHDLFKGTCPWHDKACKYYEDLAIRCIDNGHVVDVFACSLDQIGLAEIKVLIEKTGGLLVLSDMFDTNVFVESIKQMFAPNEDGLLDMAFDGEIEVLTSRQIKVQGAIGPMSSKEQKAPCVADTEIGIGKTNLWRLGGVKSSTTYAFYFDMISQKSAQGAENSEGYVQYVTQYRDIQGYRRIRVTTIQIPLVDSSSDYGQQQVLAGFDQEAAAVLIGRQAVFKSENEFDSDVLHWIDRHLIRLVAKFARYTKGDAESFQLGVEMSYYPQFMFHIRRSQLLSIFNSSPDETAFFRMLFQRESVMNSSTMIQPMLIAYQCNDENIAPFFAVQLDAASINPDHILVLDTFFNVVLWYGKNIAQWRDEGLGDDPDYAYFKDLLDSSREKALELVRNRDPVPVFVETDQDGSQSRFLVARLNPSVTHNTQSYGGQNGPPPVFTDDVSLKIFMQHLRSLAVQSDS